MFVLSFCIQAYSCTVAWWGHTLENETSCQIINIRKRVICVWLKRVVTHLKPYHLDVTLENKPKLGFSNFTGSPHLWRTELHLHSTPKVKFSSSVAHSVPFPELFHVLEEGLTSQGCRTLFVAWPITEIAGTYGRNVASGMQHSDLTGNREFSHTSKRFRSM
jgi:hypothetical protein